MSSLVERFAQLTVGTVEAVSPVRIDVLLDVEAPQATALNTGAPTGFPRINGYVLIPNEAGAVVGLITWLGVERSAFPKRTGLKDFGLIDLPYPLRKMHLTPLGMLVYAHDAGVEDPPYRLQRGVSVFPSVGDSVLLPTAEQLRSIVEVHGTDRRVRIGVAPLAARAPISVDPNRLFGHHLAVLGNTGSGKSCTVAGLIRWCLTCAQGARESEGRQDAANARFIILDPNGEYAEAFRDMDAAVRVFRVGPPDRDGRPLTVPAWMWDSHEWSAVAQAQPGAQRPLLLQALRELRGGSEADASSFEVRLARLFRARLSQVRALINDGPSAYSGAWQAQQRCGELVQSMRLEAASYHAEDQERYNVALSDLESVAGEVVTARSYSRREGGVGYNAFSEVDVERVAAALQGVVDLLPELRSQSSSVEDAPIRFEVGDLPGHLQVVATGAGGGGLTGFIDWLAVRIRMMLADGRMRPIVAPEPGSELNLEKWLGEYIGADPAQGQIAILDLHLVPPDVLHITTGVIARLVLEALQRYRQLNGMEFPTVLVLEEAHHFVHRQDEGDAGIATPSQMCRRTFERIAREGRKFGLGLVISSQRPYELSPTVLAQCNTFILHRIVNDRDQQLVSGLVPDNLGGLLSELPSLPQRQAILLGWAAPVPILVEIDELPESECPRSSDPKFWEVWTGAETRTVDWGAIARDWTGQDLAEDCVESDELPPEWDSEPQASDIHQDYLAADDITAEQLAEIEQVLGEEADGTD